ncbi:MAG: TonB-dependent receptor [Tannerellaceae bacterium]|jgi:TonB-linked SusC/RagA family outer membrane protein|nr:TonB-dependent receptor [Tannerellaceae bacterium]
MKKLICIILCLLACFTEATAQTSRITGKVISADDGEPIVGASVLVKGTAAGVITDANGTFTFNNLPAGARTLTISYVGMVTREVAAAPSITVELSASTQNLDEVMVVAYGTGKKSTFTGSAAVVKSESLDKIKTSNVTQALQGQTPGIQVINNSGQPGDDATIMIRGIGSMNASSNPLYVVDGVVYDGNINAVSPSDIESITILKDASATALYGSRAANGVIMITTKRGASDKGAINFRLSRGYSSLAVDMPRQLTPGEFTELTWRAMMNGYMDNNPTKPASEAARYATDNLANELKVNPYSIAKPVGLDGKIDPAAKLLYWGDWRNEILESRAREEYTIDFSGRSEKGDYFLSGGYVNDRGIFTAQKFERFSTRMNLNYDVKPWAKVGVNTSFSHGKRELWLDGSTIWFLRTISPNYPVYEVNPKTGEYILDGQGRRIYDYGPNRATWIEWNPLADAAYNPSPQNTDNLSSRMYAEITFTPSLKFRTNVSVDYYLQAYDGYTSSEHGYAAGYGGEAYKEHYRMMSYTINNLLTYSQTFGKHTVSALAGQEAYSTETKYLMASKRGFPFGGLTEINSAAEMNDMGSYTDRYRLLSWLSRIEYDFDDKYYLSGSFRTDGSSRFHPGNRWGEFWSAGASWRLSQEEFIKQFTVVDNLKIKASYGAVGNDMLNTYYAYQGLYATGMNDYNAAGVLVSRLSNAGLKWESNIQLNAGIEFGFFNRINGTLEWFNRTSKDLLFPMPMPPSTGFGSIDRNIGNVKNAGVEGELSYTPVMTKKLRWTVTLNATHYRNTIVKLPQDEMNSGVFKWREGESRYNFWGVEYAGVNPENGNDRYWQNIYETVDGEKVLKERTLTEDLNALTSDDQKTYLGDAIPKLFGGVGSSLAWSGIDFSFMLYYSLGGKLYDTDYSQMMAYRTGYSLHPDMLSSWTPDNATSPLPRLSQAKGNVMGSYSSKYVFDNSFARLRNVTLGYTLPKAVTGKVQINSLRLFIQADNPLTWGKAAGRNTDPEQSISGQTSNRFPTTKSVSFGLQLNL